MIKQSKLRDDVKLQDHQKRVIERLKSNPSLLIYHGLGSGKTLTSIAGTEGDLVDVVVPASLRPNYSKQLAQFSDDDKNRNIISYEGATRGKLNPKATSLVLDEPQKLNTATSKRTQKIIESSPNYKKKLLLTGTPIRNHPHEIAPLARILDPNDKSIPLAPKEFKNRFIKEEKVDPGFFNKVFRGMKPGVKHSLTGKDTLKDFFKGKVDYYSPSIENYPSRKDSIVDVEMSPKHRKVYDIVTLQKNPNIASKILHNINLSNAELQGLNAFMTAARLASNTTKPFGGNEVSNKIKKAYSDFKDDLKNNKRHKTVTYSNYIKGGLQEYEDLLKKDKIPYGVYKGGLSDKNRKKLVDDYNSGKIKNLLVSSAGAEGLDLKGTRSIQILEPHWNDARVEQVIGRGIRYKSHDHLPKNERTVDVKRYHSTLPKNLKQKILMSKPSMGADEYLYNLSKEKSKLNNELLKILKEEGMLKQSYHAGYNKALKKIAVDMPSFTRQDRPEKVKDIYRALKREHPDMPAEMKARIAARQGKKGKQHQGPPYKAPINNTYREKKAAPHNFNNTFTLANTPSYEPDTARPRFNERKTSDLYPPTGNHRSLLSMQDWIEKQINPT